MNLKNIIIWKKILLKITFSKWLHIHSNLIPINWNTSALYRTPQICLMGGKDVNVSFIYEKQTF